MKPSRLIISWKNSYTDTKTVSIEIAACEIFFKKNCQTKNIMEISTTLSPLYIV